MQEQSGRLIEALREVLLRPSEATYSAAIAACVEEQGGNQWETALKMYEEALYKGIDLHMHAKSNVLRACKQVRTRQGLEEKGASRGQSSRWDLGRHGEGVQWSRWGLVQL